MPKIKLPAFPHCSSSLVVILYLSQTAVSHRYCRPYYIFEVILIHFASLDVSHPIPIRISASTSDRYPSQLINQLFLQKQSNGVLEWYVNGYKSISELILEPRVSGNCGRDQKNLRQNWPEVLGSLQSVSSTALSCRG